MWVGYLGGAGLALGGMSMSVVVAEARKTRPQIHQPGRKIYPAVP